LKIPPHFTECVAFLCEKPGDEPRGTAFFAAIQHPPNARISTYLVTALHALEEAKGRELWVRINTLAGVSPGPGFEDLPTQKDDWFKHDRADIAVIPISLDPGKYAFQRVPVATFTDARYRLDASIFAGNPALEATFRANFPEGVSAEVGHEIFSPGLFVQSAGEQRNLPIVRFGHIVRMPGEEPIFLSSRTSCKKPIRAYLVETHSWGGFSGSPVFWLYDHDIQATVLAQGFTPPKSSVLELPQRRNDPIPIRVTVARAFAASLLGIVSGHYDIPTKAKDADDIETALNAGIAVVSPAENIRELLMRDDVVEDRKRRNARKQVPTATPDFAPARTQKSRAKKREDRIDIPIPTERQFLRDLDKAIRRRKSP